MTFKTIKNHFSWAVLLLATIVGTWSVQLTAAPKAPATNKLIITADKSVNLRVTTYNESAQEVEIAPNSDGSYTYPAQFTIMADGAKVASWTVNGTIVKDFFGQPNQYPYLSSSDIKTTLGVENLSGTINVALNIANEQKHKVQFGVKEGSPLNSGNVTAEEAGSLFPTSINNGDEVEDGKSIMFTALPYEGFKFKAWFVNGVEQTESSSKLTLEIKAATQVEALFASNAIEPSQPALTIRLHEKHSKPLKLGFKSKEAFKIDWGNGNITQHPAGSYFKSSTMLVEKKPGNEIKVLASDSAITAFLSNDLEGCEIENIDFKGSKALNYIWLGSSLIKKIDVTMLPQLAKLLLDGNEHLQELDVTHNPKLNYLSVSVCDSLKSLNLNQNTALKTLKAAMSGLKAIDLSQNSSIVTLDLSYCSMPGVDIAHLTALKRLNLSSMGLTAVNLPQSEQLMEVSINDNILDVTSLDAMYGQLPTRAEKDGVLGISGNPGVKESATFIAVNKGWTPDEHGVSSAINSIKSQQAAFTFEGDQLLVNGTPNTAVALYGIDGRCMALGKISSHGTATLKVNCNEGTPLIIMMGNQAYKVVK